MSLSILNESRFLPFHPHGEEKSMSSLLSLSISVFVAVRFCLSLVTASSYIQSKLCNHVAKKSLLLLFIPFCHEKNMIALLANIEWFINVSLAAAANRERAIALLRCGTKQQQLNARGFDCLIQLIFLLKDAWQVLVRSSTDLYKLSVEPNCYIGTISASERITEFIQIAALAILFAPFL